ncbi:tRNA (guanosine(37)-N1)-methyltransferase TrmD [Bartonella krasnovii]|uniref:tRNA (guanine-N(1)-)-methyltransferase n=1 Tax=Bartonella krasnovii TaxID=2267275 RepID=A0A5B9D3J4_9HYPH|nr:tRNA (guanosine(37)-N1)-methyltransferase TrmD [Bartonella krasnovii]QEE12909.1 tRNA (guanosine(37)-N1)-methyltransferase TrmD [Bartonella krasnovii]UNF29032.1 tRNA (guanosine(37)-N1)-methyltransferase TrmD [Bartonella krasnovii]UNF35389.1 tRNA (guanosine(37)-N1)-methyltransferase TrmD [Bartonella krasnovii]UNF37004.1 tRNA (guanosine(37)-N1)-methyltransferase TrmD [Bartonella krasnovii]UNF38703.1 tRNA (guanosine(37)-N1)-methyltransferase TrmD [Bartonella krasnovii]
MKFQARVLTLYPEMFPGFLGYSLAGQALKRGIWSLETVQIRDFALDKHHSVDDTPAGGGAGMVMRADVLAAALDYCPKDSPRLLMSPRGRPFDQAYARSLASDSGITLVCGRFEGVDERVIEARELKEVSIGDYILSGGETAALVILDAIIRLLPGVMGNEASAKCESFENCLLEHPQYTRPSLFEGRGIPSVLTSGHHKAIADWRQSQAELLTRQRRPDLYARYDKNRQKT